MEISYQSPFVEWHKISFEEIENIKIEDSFLRFYYKSFFKLLHLPHNTLKAFYTLLIEDPK